MSGREPTCFGTMLRDCRVASGLTQEQLAERSGLGVRTIQGLERGESQPRRDTLRLLTAALHLTAGHAAAFERAGQPAPRRRRAASGDAAAPGGRGATPAPRHNCRPNRPASSVASARWPS